MRKRCSKYGVICVLVLVLLLVLLATAGSATARAAPSFTWYGGLYDQVDLGDYRADTPAIGNATHFHWRFYSWMQARLPGDAEEQSYWYLYDWNYVALDKPGPDYPADPESLIPGWHFHWGTGIVSTDLPNYEAPFEPPKATWLWTTKLTGYTTPAGVHYITEYWTGCNKYKGLKALCKWTMRQADFQDATGKVWILR